MRGLFTVRGRIRLLQTLNPEKRESFTICEDGFLKDGYPFSDESMLNFLFGLDASASRIIMCLGVPVNREEEYVNARLAAIEAPSA